MYLPLDQLTRDRGTVPQVDQATIDNAIERILREGIQARGNGGRLRN